MRGSENGYLQLNQITGIWRVRIVVPTYLIPFLTGENVGKKHLTKSTGSRERAAAEKIAEPIIAEFTGTLVEAERQSLRDPSWRHRDDGLDPEIEYEEEVSYNDNGDVVIHKTDRPKPPPPCGGLSQGRVGRYARVGWERFSNASRSGSASCPRLRYLSRFPIFPRRLRGVSLNSPEHSIKS
jgi:hypothetical protein